jgi:hypothetical protein
MTDEIIKLLEPYNLQDSLEILRVCREQIIDIKRNMIPYIKDKDLLVKEIEEKAKFCTPKHEKMQISITDYHGYNTYDNFAAIKFGFYIVSPCLDFRMFISHFPTNYYSISYGCTETHSEYYCFIYVYKEEYLDIIAKLHQFIDIYSYELQYCLLMSDLYYRSESGRYIMIVDKSIYIGIGTYECVYVGKVENDQYILDIFPVKCLYCDTELTKPIRHFCETCFGDGERKDNKIKIDENNITFVCNFDFRLIYNKDSYPCCENNSCLYCQATNELEQENNELEQENNELEQENNELEQENNEFDQENNETVLEN